MLSSNKGSTLLEVLAAITILGIIAAVFLSVTGQVTLSFSHEDKRTTALNLASQQLNSTLNQILSTQPPPAINSQNRPTVAVSGHPGFSITINETALTGSPSYNGLPSGKKVSLQAVVTLYDTGRPSPYVPRLITVTVSWDG